MAFLRAVCWASKCQPCLQRFMLPWGIYGLRLWGSSDGSFNRCWNGASFGGCAEAPSPILGTPGTGVLLDGVLGGLANKAKLYCTTWRPWKPHVFSGNLLAVRAILICWVLAALGHTFLLEQPAGSRFRFFPQWRFFCKYICTVFRQGLWMRHYGSESCKHTFLWSNSSGVRHLSLGRLTKEQRETAVPLATKNIDQSGKRRATGVKKRLKKSQTLARHLWQPSSRAWSSQSSGTWGKWKAWFPI